MYCGLLQFINTKPVRYLTSYSQSSKNSTYFSPDVWHKNRIRISKPRRTHVGLPHFRIVIITLQFNIMFTTSSTIQFNTSPMIFTLFAWKLEFFRLFKNLLPIWILLFFFYLFKSSFICGRAELGLPRMVSFKFDKSSTNLLLSSCTLVY